MAAKEMYDYLTTVAADVDVTLGAGSFAIQPAFSLPEAGGRNQVVFEMDDESEVVIELDSSVYFTTKFSWKALNESDSGAIFDLFYNSAYADCLKNSIKWDHPTDGHTYVIKFKSMMNRPRVAAGVFDIDPVDVKIIGRIAD
jgi:hypothetical protein